MISDNFIIKWNWHIFIQNIEICFYQNITFFQKTNVYKRKMFDIFRYLLYSTSLGKKIKSFQITYFELKIKNKIQHILKILFENN